MADQATVNRLQEGIKLAAQEGNNDLVQIYGKELRRLQQQEQADLAKLEESIERLPKAPRPSPLDIAKDIVVSPIKGTVLGSAGIAGLPGLAQSGISSMMGKDISEAPPSMMAAPLPQYQDIMNLIERIPGAKRLTQYQAKTPLGKPLQTLGEFVGPAIPFTKPFQAGGIERMSRALKIGGAAAVPAYALEDYPYAAIPASLLAGGGVAFATAPSRAAEAAKAVLKDVSDEEIALAKEVQRQASELDIPITAAELIDNKLIRSLGETVYGSEKGGEIMFNYLKGRPEQVKNIATNLLDEIIKEPGSTKKLTREISEVAEAAILNAKQIRKKESQKFYEVADTEFVEDSQVNAVIQKIDEIINGIPGQTEGLAQGDPAIRKLVALKTSLRKKPIKAKDQPEILDELGQPVPRKTIKHPQTNINTLDSILKRFDEMVVDSKANIAQPESFIAKDARRYFTNSEKTGVLDMLDDVLKTNDNYFEAKTAFEKLSREVVDPVIASIGPLAKKNISMKKIKNFIFNLEENSADDIIDTYKILNKTDPEAFPKIARVYIKSVMEKSLRKTKKGEESLKSGFNLWDKLTLRGERVDNFNAMLKGIAESQGANPNNVVLGFDKFNNVLQRISRIANVDNPRVAPSDQFLFRDIAQFGSFMWHVKFAAKLNARVKNKTIEDLANIFTDKNSVALLEKLAKTNPASDEAQKIVRTILYYTNNLKSQEERDREAYIEQLQSGAVQPQVAIPAE